METLIQASDQFPNGAALDWAQEIGLIEERIELTNLCTSEAQGAQLKINQCEWIAQ